MAVPISLQLKAAAEKERAGFTHEADRILRALVAQVPGRHDVQEAFLQFLGRSGRPAERVAHAESLAAARPGEAAVLVQLAAAQLAAGADATAACESALRLSRDHPEAWEYLGVAQRRAGRLPEAIMSLRRALKLRPAGPGVRVNLANALRDDGQFEEALTLYQTVLKLQPGMTLGRFNLADLLLRAGKLDEAERELRQCIAEMPGLAAAYATLGALYKQRVNLQQAAALLRRAAELDPGLAEVRFNLASVLADLGDRAGAQAQLDTAIQLRPLHGRARAFQVVVGLPMVPADDPEAQAAPAAFARAMDDYSHWRALTLDAQIVDDEISALPFLLAYRDGNHREALARFADSVGPQRLSPALLTSRRDRLRVGIVSRHVRRHSVWDVVVRGIVTQLDQSRFETFIYHLGHQEDGQTALAKRNAAAWRGANAATGLASWAQLIVADAPDVLIYPELGMDPMTWALARLRLAPRQLASWGHPITTGLASIDGFLSGDLLEPADAQSHYRENLIRLPGTGCFTEPLEVAATAPPPELKALLDRAGPILLAPQMPFKFAPADDALIAEIVARVPGSILVLALDPKVAHATDLLVARLGRAFRQRGLDPAQSLSLSPWLQQDQFQHLLDRARLVLDCAAFSGYTTAWMALQQGTPLVTLEGAALRQRLAAGLLRRVDRTDTVATDRVDYVARAVRIASESDGDARSRRVALRQASERANRDTAVIDALGAELMRGWGARL